MKTNMKKAYEKLIGWIYLNTDEPNNETLEELCDIVNLVQIAQLNRIQELTNKNRRLTDMLVDERMANGKEYLSEPDDTHKQ